MLFVLLRLVVGNVEADLGVADHAIEVGEARVDLASLRVSIERGLVIFLLVGIVGLLDRHPRFDLLYAAYGGEGKNECREKAQLLFHAKFELSEY